MAAASTMRITMKRTVRPVSSIACLMTSHTIATSSSRLLGKAITPEDQKVPHGTPLGATSNELLRI